MAEHKVSHLNLKRKRTQLLLRGVAEHEREEQSLVEHKASRLDLKRKMKDFLSKKERKVRTNLKRTSLGAERSSEIEVVEAAFLAAFFAKVSEPDNMISDALTFPSPLVLGNFPEMKTAETRLKPLVVQHDGDGVASARLLFFGLGQVERFVLSETRAKLTFFQDPKACSQMSVRWC